MTSTWDQPLDPELKAIMDALLQAQLRSGSEVQEALADEADPQRAQHAEEARDKGWTEPENFNFADQADPHLAQHADQADPQRAHHVEEARDRGWTEPEKFDYAKLEGTKKEDDHDDAAPEWAASATKYEWKEEYGDLGPEHALLERQLFQDAHQMRQGTKFETLATIKVSFESKTQISPTWQFKDAGLHPVMLNNIKLCGYEVPTPIQAYVLPAIFENHDVVGIAQTGSGKTAAFLIPVISKLMGKAKKLAAPRPLYDRSWTRDQAVRAEPLVLVVVPTRELATQIFNEARRLCYRSMLRPCVIYGGAPTRLQLDDVGKGCDILIATPGRLKDFVERGHVLSLGRVKYTIVDEADEMVTPDWVDDMKLIMGGADANVDGDKIYMMFSATFPKEARAVAKEYMANDYVRIRVGRVGSTHKNITQNIIMVAEMRKRDCLWDLLLSADPIRTMIFVNSKKAVDFLDDFLYNRGLPSTSIHADRNQREREDALRAFKQGRAPILISTGVAARGLDISNVCHVINYDMPSSDHGGIDEYVHRIGRTARIGNLGVATSFYTQNNEDIAEPLTKLLIENDQQVPDFLEAFKPDHGEPITFDDDTDTEVEDGGVPTGVVPTGGNDKRTSWGTETTTLHDNENSWGAGADANAGWE